MNETYSEYLAHHGILGMKWGKKNGPPYPLTSAQMSPKERAKNDVSEFAAKTRLTRAKEREKVRQAKFKEREQRRQNIVQEKEERRHTKFMEKERARQNKVDEKESARINRVDEQEAVKQDAAVANETYRRYQIGKKYVTRALLGIGATAVAGYGVYKLGKSLSNNRDAANAATSETIGLARQAAANARQKETEEFILSKGLTKLMKIKDKG